MIVVRNVFQLEFGQAKEALSLWKDGMAKATAKGLIPGGVRLLTDVTGPAYTLVAEFTYESLAQFESVTQTAMKDPEWRAWYPKFIPLARSSYREILTIVE